MHVILGRKSPVHAVGIWLLAAASIALAAVTGSAEAATDRKFSDWGWPLPYEKASQRSVDWLKEKGWWPIRVAFSAPWSGQNAVNIVMDREKLLQKRGLEAEWQAFTSGPAINEVVVSGRFQVGNAGNFPYTSLVDKKVPIKTIAILSPNLFNALLVPNNSPLHRLTDLRGRKTPAVIGLVTGSSAEFYLQMAASVNGIEIGKDVILKNLPTSEQLLFPGGLAAVAAWDPIPALIVGDKKNGRIIDDGFAYSIFQGSFYVRQDLIDNVPDVVQAISDAHAEAVLWIRRNPDKAVDLMLQDPNLKRFPRDIILHQLKAYNTIYSPTYIYPHADFWGAANEPVYRWLHEKGRLVRPLGAADFAATVDATFMAKTFDKLGWAIPKRPPFIPDAWDGDLSRPPYPKYVTPFSSEEPQVFPQPGDLTREWHFAGKTFRP
ncbi:MAG: ABC transporter substrate-binding protein [Burkholderiales bacterium]|nr:ABC transporter substrate-binding protein [Burkholderiales bacterium]